MTLDMMIRTYNRVRLLLEGLRCSLYTERLAIGFDSFLRDRGP
jgi:hypothetical protein